MLNLREKTKDTTVLNSIEVQTDHGDAMEVVTNYLNMLDKTSQQYSKNYLYDHFLVLSDLWCRWNKWLFNYDPSDKHVTITVLNIGDKSVPPKPPVNEITLKVVR